ncbi:hypothetical protein [Bremerella sp. P1]|uniref:hypothetical protein n=1 Tax=Bremerella sp. P1 TaxID=3026424 RepID=UPI002367AF74|nr:hypothetical protein [Bremerella sp. P1]WDI44793.1 hypothetical protein PSR63_12690 [Bremerella sp. P1]
MEGIELEYKGECLKPLRQVVLHCCDEWSDTLTVEAVKYNGVDHLCFTVEPEESSVALDQERAGELASILKHYAETGKFEA